MNIKVWKLVVWLVTTVGVAGTLALLVLFPGVMSLIFKGVMSALGLVLSYRVGCALLAALVTAGAVDYWRHSRDDAAFAAMKHPH